MDTLPPSASKVPSMDTLSSPSKVPFTETEVVYHTKDVPLTTQPTIVSEINNGLFWSSDEQEWTCYRRNYFTLTCCFRLNPKTPASIYLGQSGQQETHNFALSISAFNDHNEPVGLVQHIVNRDKGKMGPPGPIIIQQGHIATFDRIQFKCATAHNGRRRAQQEDFFVVVELSACIHDNTTSPITIAKSVSAPLVVRGRSPGHYSILQTSNVHQGIDRESLADGLNHLPSDARDFEGLVVRGKQVSKSASNQNENERTLPSPFATDHTSNELQDLNLNSTAKEVLDITGTPTVALAQQGTEFWLEADTTKPSITTTTTEDTENDKIVPNPASLSDSYNSSISSVPDLWFNSTASSASSLGEWFEAADGLVNQLLKDNGLMALCADGFSQLNSDRFETNLRRLLEGYAADLRRKASGEFEIAAARFIRVRLRYIANRIRKIVHLETAIKGQEMETLLSRRIDKKQLIEKYVSRSQNEVIGGNHDLHQDNEVDLDLTDSDTGSGERVNDKSVGNFFVNDDAFEDLREGLMGFVVPQLVTAQKLTLPTEFSVEQSPTDISQIQSVGLILTLKHIKGLRLVSSTLMHQCKRMFTISYKDLFKSLSDLQEVLIGIENTIAKTSELQVDIPTDHKEEILEHVSTVENVLGRIVDEIEKALTTALHKRYRHRGAQDTKSPDIKGPCIPNVHEDEASQEYSGNTMSILQKGLDSQIDWFKFFLNVETASPLSGALEQTSFEANSARHKSLAPSYLETVDGDKNENYLAPEASLSLDKISHLATSSIGKVSSNTMQTANFFENCQLLSKMILRTLHRLTRPQVQSGYRRIEWICDCGDDLWGDFSDSEPAAVTALAEELQHHPGSVATTSSHPTPSDLDMQFVVQPSANIPNSQRVLGASDATKQVPILATESIDCSYLPLVEKYLELCVNTGEYDISLAEIEISTAQSSIVSDGDLFCAIRAKYRQHHGFLKTHNFSLFKPVEVRFVQFCLEDGDVGILKSPLSFPGKENVEAKEWEFCPCPCPLRETTYTEQRISPSPKIEAHSSTEHLAESAPQKAQPQYPYTPGSFPYWLAGQRVGNPCH